MPRLSTIASLQKAIASLMEQRQRHIDALVELDTLLSKYGISLEGNKRRGRKSGPGKRGRRRGRGHFAQNASEFILGLVKRKRMTTAEVNAAWKKAGRGGKADNALGKLVADRKLKREKLKEGKGSAYRAA